MEGLSADEFVVIFKPGYLVKTRASSRRSGKHGKFFPPTPLRAGPGSSPYLIGTNLFFRFSGIEFADNARGRKLRKTNRGRFVVT